MPNGLGLIVILVILVGVIFILFRWAINSTRCPECKKGSMIFVNRRELPNGDIQITDKCNQCGYVKKRKGLDCSPYYVDTFLNPPSL